MLWHQSHWSELNTPQLGSHVYRTLHKAIYEVKKRDDIEIKPWNPDKHKVANVLEATEALAHLDAEIHPPEWIGLHSAAETAAAQMISCENALLDPVDPADPSAHTDAVQCRVRAVRLRRERAGTCRVA
ncbi:MAG TPA: hypothetical protein VFC01_17610 [Mycobacterium sp.]|nr:hypothetical protein [Mycobacterium sp.]